MGLPRAARPRRRRARRARLRRAPRGPRARPLRARRRRLARARRPTPSATSPDGPPGAGLVAVGGFAFAPDGARAPHWSGFGAADLIVPELALARRGRDVRLTVSVARRARRRARRARRARSSAGSPSCASAPLPLLDPAPAGRFRIASTAPPEHYEAAVARAVERIRAGAFEKIVLAREVAVHAPGAARRGGRLRRPARRLRLLLRLLRRPRRQRLRRRLARAARAPRGPARLDGRARRLDAPLGRPRRRRPPRRAAAASSAKDREEQAIVTRRIARALRPHSVWVAAPDEPAIVRVANIQHLATPIRAQLTQPRSAIELAGAAAPDARGRRRAARGRRSADPRLRGAGPRLVRRPGRLDGRQRGRRVLRRPALRAAARRARRGSTPASASCATPIPPPSWPRPRSSSARCCPVAGAARPGAACARPRAPRAPTRCGRRRASPAGARPARSARTRAARAR